MPDLAGAQLFVERRDGLLEHLAVRGGGRTLEVGRGTRAGEFQSRAPRFPDLLWNFQGLRPILQFLEAQNNLQANLIFALALTVLFGGIMSMIYGYTYTLFGPPRYGPLDEPPIRIKVKRYKR